MPVFLSGSLLLTGSICTSQGITGATIYGVTAACAPTVFGTTAVCGPTIFGSTAVCSPTVFGTTAVCSPTVFGTTRVCSANLCATTTICGPSFVGGTMSGTTLYGSTVICGASICTTGNICAAGSITGSSILSTGQITAQTLVVSTISSSVTFSSGSNIFGNSTANTQTMTGSVNITGSLAVFTAGTSPEFQVVTGGTIKGNALTDVHQVTGSLRVTGSGNHFIVGGNVGIGTCSPTLENNIDVTELSVAKSGGAINVGAINLQGDRSGDASACTRIGTINFWQTTNNIARINGLRGGANNSGVISFETNNAGAGLIERMRITSAGIACFACQVCAGGRVSAINSGVDGTFQDAFVGIYSGNSNEQNAIQTSVSSIAANSGFLFMVSCGAGLSTRSCGYRMVRSGHTFYTSNTPRFIIDDSGISCFSNTVCAPTINMGGTGARKFTLYTDGVSGTCNSSGFGVDLDGASYGAGAFFAYGNSDDGRFVIGSLQNTTFRSKFTIFGSGIGCFASTVCAPGLYLGGALASSGDAAAITLKQTSTTAATGIYLERSGEQKGYYMYVGGSVDSLTFQRNNAGTKADVMALSRDGNVGIGVTNPTTAKLVIYDSAAAASNTTLLDLKNGSDGGVKLVFSNSVAAELASITAGVTSTGAGTDDGVLIFNTSANAVASERMRITSGGITCFSGTVCAPCFATISDYRMKSNLRPIDGLSIIMNTKPYKFDYNYDCAPSFGMIAHELQEVVPEAVFGEKDGENMQGVDYMKLLPIAIKAIQEQHCTICTQALRITLLESCLGLT